MTRKYSAVIEVEGNQWARSKPLIFCEATAWINDKKRFYKNVLIGKSWQAYFEIMSEGKGERYKPFGATISPQFAKILKNARVVKTKHF